MACCLSIVILAEVRLETGRLDPLCLMRICKQRTLRGCAFKYWCSCALSVSGGTSHWDCFVVGLKKYSRFFDLL